MTEKPLVAYFRTFGHVVDCSVVRDRDTGISRGFAFLTFLDDTEADAAVEFQQHLLDGKSIRVSYAQKGIVPQARKINEASIMDNVVRFIVITYIGKGNVAYQPITVIQIQKFCS